MNRNELIRSAMVGLGFVGAVASVAGGCGGSGGTGGSTSTGGATSATSATSTKAATTTGTTTATTTTTGAGTTTASTGTGACTNLTVKNFTSWCSVSVNGGTAKADAAQTVCVQAGNIPLTASPNTGFELGANMWHHTSGDSAGTGEKGTVTGTTSAATAVVMSGTSKCVWVCCPFTNGTGCDNLPEQCP